MYIVFLGWVQSTHGHFVHSRFFPTDFKREYNTSAEHAYFEFSFILFISALDINNETTLYLH